ncbi:GNAT family N-acetyltransferase [Legionella waltersii]|uniref:GNAT family acetyltransferase n=1 Tax=Legionella waltersii TaxID=66969 RepID=A0A0W1A737_9GAMM|nr:GNAT family N-acetyltransferase [Legionella waltersii]KTD77183.1 GNAT family acetyltransferase [Legionella waltersii]SNV11321.1 N-acetylglutamate synthase [Legionella waltersii]
MIEIRLANLKEVDTLNQLIIHSANDLSQGFYTKEEIQGAVQFVFGVDTQLIVDGTYFVVEENRIIVACGGWSKRETLFGGNQFKEREEDSVLDPHVDAAKIRAFFVHPEHARKGHGSTLLKHCEQHALTQGFSKFEMMATLPGVKLYEKSGYSKQLEQLIELPNQICVRFVHMMKYLNEN